ncbi:hypothetical protein BDR26DRAFT_1005496 [Obelidium mucronatum]|nr:hypothetical protein BDR26DRAFT_1005496 [Obelidium mucronatum]
MLSLERVATKAKIDHETRFLKERAEISDAERRAAAAVSALVKKQQALEKHLAALSLKGDRGSPRRQNTDANAKTKEKEKEKPKYARKKVLKVGGRSKSHHEERRDSSSSICIPRVSITAQQQQQHQQHGDDHHSNNRCQIIYTDLEPSTPPEPERIRNANYTHHHHTTQQPENIQLSPPRNLSLQEKLYTDGIIQEALSQQAYRQKMLTFLRNLEEEETVTTLFLNSAVTARNQDGWNREELEENDEDGLPSDWRVLSVEFGKRLKHKIGELVGLYNEYFEKMERVQD